MQDRPKIVSRLQIPIHTVQLLALWVAGTRFDLPRRFQRDARHAIVW